LKLWIDMRARALGACDGFDLTNESRVQVPLHEEQKDQSSSHGVRALVCPCNNIAVTSA
jgi:hypothetical protein